jgi:hypothetical protein
MLIRYRGGATQFFSRRDNLFELQTPGKLRAQQSKIPRTILDAIEVCRKANVPYLWVDSLCIQQDCDPQEKIQQIKNMDSIYKGSDFTIVAADGKDANAGIAGVSVLRTLS